eukprot:m.45601 g.45601  ORF g.45601 m.45601 type:complete len:102 (-) comp47275_c0_seq1:851-1156(-)
MWPDFQCQRSPQVLNRSLMSALFDRCRSIVRFVKKHQATKRELAKARAEVLKERELDHEIEMAKYRIQLRDFEASKSQGEPPKKPDGALSIRELVKDVPTR